MSGAKKKNLQAPAAICGVATCAMSLTTSLGVASLASLGRTNPFKNCSFDAHRTWNRTTRTGYCSGTMLFTFWNGFRSRHVQPPGPQAPAWGSLGEPLCDRGAERCREVLGGARYRVPGAGCYLSGVLKESLITRTVHKVVNVTLSCSPLAPQGCLPWGPSQDPPCSNQGPLQGLLPGVLAQASWRRQGPPGAAPCASVARN